MNLKIFLGNKIISNRYFLIIKEKKKMAAIDANVIDANAIDANAIDANAIDANVIDANAIDSDEFRLISFNNTYDKTFFNAAEAGGGTTEQEDNNKNKSSKELVVQMFGINEKGQTASIFVEGYLPFFYIKVGDEWKESQRIGFIKQIKTYGLNETDEDIESAIVKSKLIKKKKL